MLGDWEYSGHADVSDGAKKTTELCLPEIELASLA